MNALFISLLAITLTLSSISPVLAVEQIKKFKVKLDKIEGTVTKFPFKFRWNLYYMSPARHDYYRSIPGFYSLDKATFEQYVSGKSNKDLAFYIAVSPADKNTGDYFVYNASGEKYRADSFLFAVVTGGNGFVTNSDAYPQECITNMAEEENAAPCGFVLEDNNITYYFSINRVGET